ncbi:hypothetical protein ON010_g5952 [Phytophthora cinnamomi]|nr:hypothetical protein ON010_g5952 [Phytophthora cinnamomi]
MFSSSKIFTVCTIAAAAISGGVRAEKEVAETFFTGPEGVGVGIPGVASVTVGGTGAYGPGVVSPGVSVGVPGVVGVGAPTVVGAAPTVYNNGVNVGAPTTAGYPSNGGATASATATANANHSCAHATVYPTRLEVPIPDVCHTDWEGWCSVVPVPEQPRRSDCNATLSKLQATNGTSARNAKAIDMKINHVVALAMLFASVTVKAVGPSTSATSTGTAIPDQASVLIMSSEMVSLTPNKNAEALLEALRGDKKELTTFPCIAVDEESVFSWTIPIDHQPLHLSTKDAYDGNNDSSFSDQKALDSSGGPSKSSLDLNDLANSDLQDMELLDELSGKTVSAPTAVLTTGSEGSGIPSQEELEATFAWTGGVDTSSGSSVTIEDLKKMLIEETSLSDSDESSKSD